MPIASESQTVRYQANMRQDRCLWAEGDSVGARSLDRLDNEKHTSNVPELAFAGAM